jgi:hypothetical protein
VEIGIADDELAAISFLDLCIDPVFPRAFASLEAGQIRFQRCRPESAALDDDFSRRASIGVELNGIAGDARNFAVPDSDVSPPAGNAVGVTLLLKCS